MPEVNLNSVIPGPLLEDMGLGGQGLDPNLKRFVMPKWLLMELPKYIPSYSSGPLLMFCYYCQVHEQPFCFGTALKMHILILITSSLNLRRFVIPTLLLIEPLKKPPSYFAGPLLVFCYYFQIHEQPFCSVKL